MTAKILWIMSGVLGLFLFTGQITSERAPFVLITWAILFVGASICSTINGSK